MKSKWELIQLRNLSAESDPLASLISIMTYYIGESIGVCYVSIYIYASMLH